ncbi:hypothetical protein AMECASPLE_034051 [Ameca splendens]|uniref:Uncharacterized protein n=1 Tax=Ameca splendens TaxID=208324 RepID=A0ABV0Z4Z8_9TELE
MLLYPVCISATGKKLEVPGAVLKPQLCRNDSIVSREAGNPFRPDYLLCGFLFNSFILSHHRLSKHLKHEGQWEVGTGCPNSHFSALWEEGRVPGENPRMHRENVQKR